ncbi:MAG: protein BatD [Paludibacteraceae bacterium]|nr:protein BatD [Paludibacteraceae bacterium]
MKRIGLIGLLFIGACLALWADEVQFTAQAPETVVAGQQFRLVYTVNQDAKDLRAPEMTDFDVLMGPSVSSQRSMQIINGSVTHSHTISHTFILVGNTPGTYTIAPASIMVKNQKYTSQSVTIKVLPPDQQSAVSSSNANANTRSYYNTNNSSQSDLSAKQIFVRQSISKTNIYEQEAVLVSYRLYSRVDIAQIGNAKFPEFKDFYVQEINLDPNRPWQMEHYDGLNYNTIVLKQYLLFPQRTGEIKLDATAVEAVVRIPNNTRSNNPFADFFNTYQEVKKELKVPATKLKVKALPKGAPAGFSGAVGQFQLRSEISNPKANVNDAITLKLHLSGKGNLKLAKVPQVSFPADFDTYDPKNDNNIKVGVAGVSGSKTVEYVAIPRFGGTFTIPAAKFVYFDPIDEKYKTLTTQSYNLTITGSAADATVSAVVPGVHKEQVKNLGTDIRFIHHGDQVSMASSTHSFYGTALFYLSYLVPLLLFVIMLILLQKQAKENANLVKVKNKRANKLARKRLKNAAICMKKGDKNKFYEAAVQALWGYTADKLNIPLANLTKDNVQEELLRHGASQELIDSFIATLSDCEFARYSPVVDDSLSMENCYNRAAELIGKLEERLN